MRSKVSIDKVIDLNGSYEIRNPFPACVVGWGNCVFPTAHIQIFREKNEYIIFVYNTNDEKRMYRPHRTYKYVISNKEVNCYDGHGDEISYLDRFYPPTPFGWNKLMTDTLTEVLNVLYEG